MARYRSDTGLELDDSDPEDAKILGRQRAAARAAGAQGGDRAGATRGRADLAEHFDAGAAEGAAPVALAPAPAAKPAGGRGATSKTKGGRGGLLGSLPRPTLKPPARPTAKDLGGFAFGLVVHALVVSYIRYGAAGPKGWMSAKFLNKPLQGEDLERENRKDANNGVDPAPSGRGPNGEIPAEGHMDENTEIM